MPSRAIGPGRVGAGLAMGIGSWWLFGAGGWGGCSAAGRSWGSAAGGQLAEPVLQRDHGCGLKAVVDPAALLPRFEQARVLQHPEVKGELGLGQAQLIGEFADAALPPAESLDHPQAQGIGQGFEQGAGLLMGQRVIQNTAGSG